MSDPIAGEPDLLEEAARLIDELAAHPDPAVREKVELLLQHVDTVHRVGLTRLLGMIRQLAGEPLVHRLAGDPGVRVLLQSYDLLEVDRRLLAEEALDLARGPLHEAGIDVELRDVVGGVVYARLHRRDGAGLTDEEARERVEAGLREGLLGFQELVIGDRWEARAPTTVIPLASLRAIRKPTYRDALASVELPPGALVAVTVEAEPVLLARTAEGLFAVRNRCGNSPLVLQHGTLEGSILTCPWHGCRWDLRDGSRLDGAGDPLYPLAVREQGGRIEIAVRAREGS